jgi:hypothetical protein
VVADVGSGRLSGVVKQRARWGEPPLPSATVIVRGDLLDPEMLAESAERNFAVYGFYGISVFAETSGVAWVELAETRFKGAAWIVLFTAGDLAAAGLELWDTGMAPHYDVVHEDRNELVARMLFTTHRAVPNPHVEPGGDRNAENRLTSRFERRGRRGPLVDPAHRRRRPSPDCARICCRCGHRAVLVRGPHRPGR